MDHVPTLAVPTLDVPTDDVPVRHDGPALDVPALESWLARTYGLVAPVVTSCEARASVDLVRIRAAGRGEGGGRGDGGVGRGDGGVGCDDAGAGHSELGPAGPGADRPEVGPPGADTGHAYWLRIYSRSRVPVTALEEEAAITVVIAREVEVAAAVPTSGGRFVATWSGGGVAYPALLYREVRGTAVASPSARQAANLGALLATVHAAGSRLAESRLAESRLAESRLAPWACVDAVALAASGLDHAVVHVRGCEIGEAELRSIVGDMRRIVERATLPRGFVHGDLHADNVRFDGDRPALLDFACCGEGPFAYDLACYWRKRVLSRSSDAPPDDWSSFVAGYSSVRALSEDELAVVPALACLRAIWVMCLPALPSEDWGAGWLADPEYVAAHLAMIRRFAGLAALSARGARA